MRVLLVAALLTLGIAGLPGPASAQSDAAAVTEEPTLDEVRTLLTRYQDVEAALADGYIRDPENSCVTAVHMGLADSVGIMGIHFLRPDLLGIAGPPDPRVNGTGTHTDFRQPAVLIYEPQADSSLTLVAVENLVFVAAWEAAGRTAPPVFQNVTYNRMADDPATPLDEAHNFEPHYDLHVWLFRENPSGMFAQFNPAATCEHHDSGAGHH